MWYINEKEIVYKETHKNKTIYFYDLYMFSWDVGEHCYSLFFFFLINNLIYTFFYMAFLLSYLVVFLIRTTMID